jgi:hypothetical protein
VRHLLTETGSAKTILNAPPEAPAAPPAPPARPVLVQPQSAPPQTVPPQTVQGRVATPRAKPAEPPADAEALVELTSLERGDPEDIVKEPPEISAPVAQIIRRLSDVASEPA